MTRRYESPAKTAQAPTGPTGGACNVHRAWKTQMGMYPIARTTGTSAANCDRSAQSPLRPSEGLLQARPRVLNPCPDDRHAGTTNLIVSAGAEDRIFGRGASGIAVDVGTAHSRYYQRAPRGSGT